MWETLLWLCAASLALSSLNDLADASQLLVLSAPNVLRVGSPENIFVECQDCTGGEQNVWINVRDYPAKSRLLSSTAVTINSANNFQAMGQITIPSGTFMKDPNLKQYVYLQAQFPGRLLEKVVLVSFQSGYIFIQTDKTIYTPNTKVHFRVFGVNPGMVPIEMDAANAYAGIISIEIVTPDGIVLLVETGALRSGLRSGYYYLPEFVSVGVWKVVARFQNNTQESYSADFEVKEYVLPSFEVKLIPGSSFFYVDSDQLHIDIRAIYLSGKEVDGTAYVLFGVVFQDRRISFPPSLQRVPVVRGEGKAILLRRHITDVSNINELVKSHIVVSVSVLTESGSEMVEAELKGIQIVTSPYTIHFKKTPKYFKPGMSFRVSVVVLNPDDSPAVGVPILVGAEDWHRGITAGNGMAMIPVNTIAGASHLDITAKTVDTAIRDDRQASAVHRARPYTSRSNNYLHIGVDSSEVKLGDNLIFNLILPMHAANQDIDITYLILSRGQLIKNERFKRQGQYLVTLSMVITKGMLPSFRIIAYYHTGTNEVVSDSVWVDVKDTCMGSLKIESAIHVPSFKPQAKIVLKVTGDPQAMVGLVAVDKGIYVLNNKHRLTQKKVWDLVEKYDTGCTAGGGRDSMGVFYDAGLLFVTSAEDGTPYRQELKCPGSGSARRKRATTITDPRGTLGEEDEDDGYEDSDWIVTRTMFFESWLWRDVQLPECDRSSPNCETTSIVRNERLPDSITTWIVTGISLSKTHGICVADSLAIVVQKPFFMDLRLPHSAVRGEQLEIKAILHNNSPELTTVRVELIESSEHVCSVASKHGKYRHPEVTLEPYTTRSVPFIIVPMKDGIYPIEVTAQVKDSYLSDGIRKLLRVVPDGELVTESKIVTLDPARHNGKQLLVIRSGISTADLVQNAPSSTQFSLTGGQQMGVFAEEAISGDSMGSLIQQPGGNGEQNMMGMTLPVIATTYLDKTNKWEDVGLNKRNEALQHIRKGYENQLSYRQRNGCFTVSNNHACSSWLTAYVVKVFAMTSKLGVPVQANVICDAVKWLMLFTQQPDGVFKEIGPVIHREMRGNVHGTDSDASMTAFILIAMQEARGVCHDKLHSMASSIYKAVANLERRMPSLTNAYAVAMTSYALANKDAFSEERKLFLYTFVSDLSHWPVPGGRGYTLEATAYALLALVKAQAFEEAAPIVRWFNKQQKTGGGYGSTQKQSKTSSVADRRWVLSLKRGQATMIVYQALSEYWASAYDYDLDVHILITGRAKRESYNINRHNSYQTRTSKVRGVNHNLTVTATGRGEATLTVVSLYYALPRERPADCQKFNLSVELIPEITVGEEKTYNMKISVLFKDRQSDSGMAILDIGLLTGFTVNSNDLDLLHDGVNRDISKYEMHTVLSERGSLIIYLNKVSHLRPDEIAFRVTQTMKVGNLKPAAVSVYEYYSHSEKCVKFYHPVRQEGELSTLCRKNDSECTCAEGTYPMTDSTAPPLPMAKPVLEEPYVRLVEGTSSCNGILEMKHQGEWRLADDDDWNLKSASVVCRQLACDSAVSTKRIAGFWFFWLTNSPVWKITSSCFGSETSLRECGTMEPATSTGGMEVICSDHMSNVTHFATHQRETEVQPTAFNKDLGNLTRDDAASPWPAVCGTCQKVLEVIYGFLEQGHPIEYALGMVCSSFRWPVSKVCQWLVNRYAPDLIEQLKQKLPPATICRRLTLCSRVSSNLDALFLDILRTYHEKAVEELTPQIGDHMSNVTHFATHQRETEVQPNAFNKDLGNLTRDDHMSNVTHFATHQRETEVQPNAFNKDLGNLTRDDLSIRLKWPAVCGTCQTVLKVIYGFLEQGHPIESALGMACNSLPWPVSKVCQWLVNRYAPDLIEQLKQKLPPATICRRLTLCSRVSSNLDALFMDMMRTYHEKAGEELKPQIGGIIHAATSESCPQFWERFNGRCYKYVSATLSWAEAELNCVSQDANLVSIHSPGEQDFVRDLIKNTDPQRRRTWIGLSDIQLEGRWMWSDGSKVIYTWWNQGEPNGGRSENCVNTNDGALYQWNDLSCSDSLASVCALHTVCP